MKDIGLSSKKAKNLLKEYGLNDVEEKKKSLLKQFLAPLYSPISLMLLGAAFLSLVNHRWFDFYFIILLYLVNYFVQKWQEFKADKAIEQLREKLSFEVATLRDGAWQMINAKYLVPGDRIKLGLGSIVPADAIVISLKNLTMNEAVLTGESLPKKKNVGDKIFSGSFISTGSVEAEIILTGKNTYFGKTIFSIEQNTQKSILEKDILSISRFLTIVSIVAVFILTLVFVIKKFPVNELLTLDLSLVIAGIPVALPTIMAVILSIGAGGLAKKKVVVRRLSALEDLANVNLLLTDKTGTLTENRISVVNVVSYEKDLDTNMIIELAHCTVSNETPDAIDLSIIKRFSEFSKHRKLKVLDLIPYDSERKRATALVKDKAKTFVVSLGAPQVIEELDDFSSNNVKKRFENDIKDAAGKGYRVLAVAIANNKKFEEKKMNIVGLLFLADPLDETAGETISFLHNHGIVVKMLTGDNQVIAQRVVKDLGLKGEVIKRKKLATLFSKGIVSSDLKNISCFSEILPKDKYDIVSAAKGEYIVAVTGDGINDLPALKIAHVGVAVSRAVSALKSMADIVLLDRGISVIKDAVIESRKIFVRLYNYSVYRISESFRLIVSILVLGLIYGFYPLAPIQLIILALLNDIPIISLALDRVKISSKPSEVNARERFAISLLFGVVGIMNSLILFFLMIKVTHLPLEYIQTMFFLKLTVSGHALIFVAHTKERWYKYLPSKEVIFATVTTQIIATVFALTGFLMPGKISFKAVVFVWVWSLFWMQISELMKIIKNRIFSKKQPV